jgi:hypothetical protein
MPVNILTDAAWLALAAATVTRSLVSLGKTMVEERSRTARFNTALKDSTPPQRAEIIESLTGGRASKVTTGESEDAPPPSPERFSLVARLLRDGRETEPGKE